MIARVPGWKPEVYPGLELSQSDVEKLAEKLEELIALRHKEEASRLLAEPEGVVSVDSSEVVKKGKESVGVARQYCGRLGKIENCQSGVYVAYTSTKGYALIDRRLFLRKDPTTKEIKYYFSNASLDTSLEEMSRVCMLRWPIEQSCQEGKSELGMSDYEHRSWPAWHRHMTFVFLAQVFLLSIR